MVNAYLISMFVTIVGSVVGVIMSKEAIDEMEAQANWMDDEDQEAAWR